MNIPDVHFFKHREVVSDVQFETQVLTRVFLSCKLTCFPSRLYLRILTTQMWLKADRNKWVSCSTGNSVGV